MGELKALVVDDEEMIRTMFSRIFSHLGLEDVAVSLSLAADGQEAVEKAKQQQYHIVFMDFKMPVMNGLEAGRAIKEMSPGTYLVFLTGYGADCSPEAQEIGDRFYNKPVPIDEIRDSVKASINYQR
jgi:CheY-like chemotaxis protein